MVVYNGRMLIWTFPISYRLGSKKEREEEATPFSAKPLNSFLIFFPIWTLKGNSVCLLRYRWLISIYHSPETRGREHPTFHSNFILFIFLFYCLRTCTCTVHYIWHIWWKRENSLPLPRHLLKNCLFAFSVID